MYVCVAKVSKSAESIWFSLFTVKLLKGLQKAIFREDSTSLFKTKIEIKELTLHLQTTHTQTYFLKTVVLKFPRSIQKTNRIFFGLVEVVKTFLKMSYKIELKIKMFGGGGVDVYLPVKG